MQVRLKSSSIEWESNGISKRQFSCNVNYCGFCEFYANSSLCKPPPSVLQEYPHPKCMQFSHHLPLVPGEVSSHFFQPLNHMCLNVLKFRLSNQMILKLHSYVVYVRHCPHCGVVS